MVSFMALLSAVIEVSWVVNGGVSLQIFEEMYFPGWMYWFGHEFSQAHSLQRSFHSAVCDKKHLLVCCRTWLSQKKFCDTKTEGKPCINTSTISQPDLMKNYAEVFERELGASPLQEISTEKGDTLRDIVHHSVFITFVKMTSERTTGLSPSCLLWFLSQKPNEINLQSVRALRSKVHQTARIRTMCTMLSLVKKFSCHIM